MNNDVINKIIDSNEIRHGHYTVKSASAPNQYSREQTNPYFSGVVYTTGNIINKYDTRFDDETYYG